MNNPLETSGYDAMAHAVKAAIEELLIPFRVASDSRQLLREMSSDEFFRKFLVYADKFTDQCCHELSKILRQTSVSPEVRGTPTLELAKQVREIVFERTDKILISYVDSLEQINLGLGEAARNLSDSSVLGEAMKGAAIGRVAGGFGETGKVLGAVGAIAAAGEEATKQLALLEQQHKLGEEARDLAFSKIVEYLKAVEALPENLLDYGCAKCFGGQIDFSKQALAVEQVRGSTKDKMRQSLELTLTLQQIEREERERARQAVVGQQQKTKRAGTQGWSALLGFCGGMLLFAAILNFAGGDAGTAGACFVFGGPLIAAAIYMIRKKKES
jgi:hypothetical protein